MIPYAVLGALLGLPLILGIIFRVTTSHLFFSLMVGELLAHYFGEEAGEIVDAMARTHVASQYSEVVVLILPIVLTAIFLKGTLPKGKIFLHFLPLAITGLVLVAFALPMLPHEVQDQLKTIEIGRQLLDLSGAIIGGVVFLQLVSLWLLNRSHEGGHGKKHKHLG